MGMTQETCSVVTSVLNMGEASDSPCVFSNMWVPMQSGNETNDLLKSDPAKVGPVTPPLQGVPFRCTVWLWSTAN